MSAETKQPPNWMGFDHFSEHDNDLIAIARRYVNPQIVVPVVPNQEQELYYLIDKLVQLLDEKESSK